MKKIITTTFSAYLIACAMNVLGDGQAIAQRTLVNSEAATILVPDVIVDQAPHVPEQFTTLTRKAPYLIWPGDNTQMQVLWQLTATDTCTIEWGSDTLYADGYGQTHEYGNYHQHSCVITDLVPGAKCHYRVTVNDELHTGSFHSAPDTSATSVKFMAYGDTRTYPASHNQVAAAMIAAYTQDEDLQSMIISVGDLVAAGDNESDWDSQFFNPSYASIKEMLATLPYQSCMGNHEQSGALFVRYFPYPFIAGRYWAFDYGPAHFVVVDQYTSYGPGSAQLVWMENDLAATTKPWKFICLHEPGWSAGNHANNVSVQNYIQPLCQQYGVSIIFAGHNHYYARAVVNGVQHVTTGGGGAPLYTPDPGYPNVVSATRAYHFCTVEIEGDVLDFRAITSAGAVIDSFTITPVVGVALDEAEPPIPDFVLHPAFPNPCNPSTTISFSITAASAVDLAIYNILGQRVRTLAGGPREAGHHAVSWNGKDDLGRDVGSGVYVSRLQSGDGMQTSKILLLR